MENSFFIFTDGEVIEIERFHICTWEFKDHKPLINLEQKLAKIVLKIKILYACLFIYLGLQMNVR